MPRYQYKYRKPQRRRIRIWWILPALLVIVMVVWPFAEPTKTEVVEHTVKVTDLADSLRNLKIVFVSDFHVGPWFSAERTEKVITKVNNLSADIVIFGGDYGADVDAALAFFRDLPKVNARIGVFGVFGEHDRDPNGRSMAALMKQMEDAGVTPLVNTMVRAGVGNKSICVAGVDDMVNGAPDMAAVASQVKTEDFVIFCGHTPDLLPSMRSVRSADGDNHWYDLALFGHTHGGQVNIMGHTPFASLVPAVGSRYLTGMTEENRAYVLVSNGLGMVELPIRFCAKPQIHLITLKKQ